MSWSNCDTGWKIALDPTCTEEQQAAYLVTTQAYRSVVGGTIYSNFPEPPMPPVVGSTVNGQPIPVVPASGEAASNTIQAITNQQISDWNAKVQSFMNSIPTTTGDTALGISSTWWKVGLIGLGVGLVINALGKRGR